MWLSPSLTAFAACAVLVTAKVTDPLSYVNLFIGTTNGGHVFPGIRVIPRSLDVTKAA